MSAQVIYKYFITSSEEALYLPADAKFLSVGEQQGKIVVWAQTNTNPTNVKRTVLVYMTGEVFQEHGVRLSFIGTVQMRNGIVAHVFELLPEVSS